MKSEDWVSTALRALAEQDAELEAPLAVEDRIRKAFRRKHAMRRWRNFGSWSLAAAAMIAIGVVAGLRHEVREGRPVPPPRAPDSKVAPQRVAARPPQVAAVDPPIADQAPASKPAPSNRQPREVVTEFFPLQDVAMPFERGELLRVTVPASTMRKVGLPVNEDHLTDRVYADVLVGEEGLTRAIRFVSYEK